MHSSLRIGKSPRKASSHRDSPYKNPVVTSPKRQLRERSSFERADVDVVYADDSSCVLLKGSVPSYPIKDTIAYDGDEESDDDIAEDRAISSHREVSWTTDSTPRRHGRPVYVDVSQFQTEPSKSREQSRVDRDQSCFQDPVAHSSSWKPRAIHERDLAIPSISLYSRARRSQSSAIGRPGLKPIHAV